MKKQLLLILAVACFSIQASKAQSTHPSILFKNHNMLTTPDLAMNVKFHLNIAQVNLSEKNAANEMIIYSRSSRYEDAVHKRNVGIGLTAAGGTCLVGGIALIAAGSVGIHNDINNYGEDLSAFSHLLEITFGTILTIAGTGMTIPGAIILAKGQHQMKKFKDSQRVN